jgi:micrococcal nuclease
MRATTLIAAAALGISGCAALDGPAKYPTPTPTPTPTHHRSGRHHGAHRQATPVATPARLSRANLTRATLNRVIDGDTIDTDAGRVRLLAIDTPEVYSHRECGGPEASAATKRLLSAGAAVRLYRDPGEPDTDLYGRLLRYVYTTRPGTDDIGRELVREGWAEVYKSYPTSKTPSYLKVQAVAKRHNRGVWGECGKFES